jgi:hypothetical protein
VIFLISFFLKILQIFQNGESLPPKKVSGYAFDILNECVPYERFKEELGRCKSGGGVALCKMCFYFV